MKKFSPDRLFYLFLTFGPLVWFVFSFILPVQTQMDRLTQDPWFYLSGILLYPVLEEVVFRGLLLEGLTRYVRARWHGLSLANVLTSLLFVVAHFPFHPGYWASAVFVPSLLFGYSKERYRSLWPPMILHSFYNLGFFLLYL